MPMIESPPSGKSGLRVLFGLLRNLGVARDMFYGTSDLVAAIVYPLVPIRRPRLPSLALYNVDNHDDHWAARWTASFESGESPYFN